MASKQDAQHDSAGQARHYFTPESLYANSARASQKSMHLSGQNTLFGILLACHMALLHSLACPKTH